MVIVAHRSPPNFPPVQIQVIYFAALADALGVREQALALRPGATVADAWKTLSVDHPALAAPGAAPVTFAVNLEYAGPDRLLADGDALALIPPVSGG